jgi:uncharacterized protein YyaL (SSP411 family)
VRARDLFDGATPSATAAACELLLRLSGPCERDDWREIALGELDRHAALMARAPSAVPALLHARLFADQGADLALPTADATGGPGAAQGAGEHAAAFGRDAFAPLATIVAGPVGSLPLLTGRRTGEAYLCRHGVCQLPAQTWDVLRTQLEQLHTLPDA